MRRTHLSKCDVRERCRLFRPLDPFRGEHSGRVLVWGASLASVYPLLLLELAVGAGYMIFGYLLFSRIERRAKRQGTLETAWRAVTAIPGGPWGELL